MPGQNQTPEQQDLSIYQHVKNNALFISATVGLGSLLLSSLGFRVFRGDKVTRLQQGVAFSGRRHMTYATLDVASESSTQHHLVRMGARDSQVIDERVQTIAREFQFNNPQINVYHNVGMLSGVGTQLNAFAFGAVLPNTTYAHIIIDRPNYRDTSGTEHLNELFWLLKHEFSHIKHNDSAKMILVNAVTLALVPYMALTNTDTAIECLGMLVGNFTLSLTAQAFVSRRAERMADKNAAKMSTPDEIKGGLNFHKRQISKNSAQSNRAFANFAGGFFTAVSSLFATYPSQEERIKILEEEQSRRDLN